MNTTVTSSGIERSKYNRKIAVRFDIHVGTDHFSTVTSAPVFRSPGAARKGAARALAVYNRTGAFPNLCVWF